MANRKPVRIGLAAKLGVTSLGGDAPPMLLSAPAESANHRAAARARTRTRTTRASCSG